MNVVRANCRNQLTAEDVTFLMRVFGQEPDDSSFLNLLLADEPARDQMLDDPIVYNTLTHSNHCLSISSHLYFYVLVRNVFSRSGIEDREVADYVASLLVEFTLLKNLPLRVPPDQAPIEYVFEMLAASARADGRTRYFIQAHIGNHTLFVSGVFAERIEHRRNTRGFPGLSYYEGVGAGSFRAARDHRLARKHELIDVFDRLSDDFSTARKALNDLAERVLHFSEPTWLSGFLSQSSGLFN